VCQGKNDKPQHRQYLTESIGIIQKIHARSAPVTGRIVF
jgi:hypothetical protein